MTILGTRPEVIRLSLIIEKLDRFAAKHIVVHTGQNASYTLRDVFFEEMNIRQPDYHINSSVQLGEQLAVMFREIEKIIVKEEPDRILILGDTNSGLCAIIAERMGIPVFHMEAGNRCFDLEVPEEKNRRVIDAISTVNLPYTSSSRENLLREGIPRQRIVVTGNPIHEVLWHYRKEIDASIILEQLLIKKKEYLLFTAHRAECVDKPERLEILFTALSRIAESYGLPIICSVHPRTRAKLKQFSITASHPNIQLCDPFSFFDFVKLEQHACCVLTDSGTVQEECCLMHVPTVTIRNTTERPETVACGSNVVSGIDAQSICDSVHLMMNSTCEWQFPEGYADPHVSDKVTKLILGGKILV